MSTTADHAARLGDWPSPAARGLLDGLPAYEQACSAVEAARLGDPDQAATLLARWFDGVTLLDAISEGRLGGDAQARVIAAMTHLATAWLSPRFAGEPRIDRRKRIASLRPVEQSERLREFMGKNTEGTLTPDARREFLRLHEFFETLQDIVDATLYSTPAQS